MTKTDVANGARSKTAPEARNIRVAPTAAGQLSAHLAWLALASKGRVTKTLTAAIMRHQRAAKTEPAILIAATVEYLIQGADREKDWLNRYWHIADQISARERARYLNTEESELQ